MIFDAIEGLLIGAAFALLAWHMEVAVSVFAAVLIVEFMRRKYVD